MIDTFLEATPIHTKIIFRRESPRRSKSSFVCIGLLDNHQRNRELPESQYNGCLNQQKLQSSSNRVPI